MDIKAIEAYRNDPLMHATVNVLMNWAINSGGKEELVTIVHDFQTTLQDQNRFLQGEVTRLMMLVTAPPMVLEKRS